MAKFNDLLASLGVAEDGISTAYPETFTADITAAYDEDMSIPAAKIAVLESELAAANAEILTLKAHNYELLIQSPVNDADPGDGNDGENEDNDENETDADLGIESLFKESGN